MRIAFVGDVHGNTSYIRSLRKPLKHFEVDLVIQVGDMGILWEHENPDDCPVVDAVKSLDTGWWFIDGNHDNHPNLRKVGEDITDRIKYIKRGSIKDIDGLKFGFLGGAYSIDKDYRIEGVDWWPEEQPTREEAEPLIGADLDVLVTHDIPSSFNPVKVFDVGPIHEEASRPTRDLVQEVMITSGARYVFSGHWHQRNVQMLRSTKATILDMENMPGNIEIYDTEDLHGTS